MIGCWIILPTNSLTLIAAESSITARERHLRSIGDAYAAFCKAEKGIVENEALDLVAEELLQAQNSLAEVTGEFTTEDLLGEIFKKFLYR